MSVWDTSIAAEERVRTWASSEGAIFASAEWANILCGLGCTVAYAWNSSEQAGMAVPVFKRGPIRVGFLGFPVAGMPFDRLSTANLIDSARELALALKLDVIRCNRPRAHVSAGVGGVSLPEIWIEDLSGWAAARKKRLTRDLAFARRATADLLLLEGGCDPLEMHRMYVGTVVRQGGTLRYTQQYFVRLVAAAKNSKRLCIFYMQTADGRNLGFAVLAMDGDTGHYLHGAVDAAARSTGMSDLLLCHLIVRAQGCGMRRFSLMASPADQFGLLRFKRKWGDSEGVTITFDIGNGMMGRALIGGRTLVSGLAANWRQRSD